MQFLKFKSTESTLDWFLFSVNLFQNWNQKPDWIQKNPTAMFYRNQNKLLKQAAKFEKPKSDSWNHTESATNYENRWDGGKSRKEL